MNYEIRSMLPRDASAVLDIFGQGIRGGNATFDKEIPNWENWEIEFINCCRLVLENSENTVVGWAALKPVSKRHCFRGVAEVSIYLADDVQGKGLGTMLLRQLILASEEHGFWMLQSGVFPENQASVAIHQKLGFRIVGTRERMAEMNGRWRDFILMERRSTVVGV